MMVVVWGCVNWSVWPASYCSNSLHRIPFYSCAVLPQSYTASPMDPQARLFYNPAYSAATAKGGPSVSGANSVAVGCGWVVE